MGITGKRWSHLVVFTKLCLADDVPPLAIRVEFDQNHFMQLVASSTGCWFKYILPEILCGRLKNQLQEIQVLDDVPNSAGIVLDPHVLDHMYSLNSASGFNNASTCPLCHSMCKEQENVRKFVERSITCDHYNSWFHFGCLKMTKKQLEELNGSNWYCQLCSKE